MTERLKDKTNFFIWQKCSDKKRRSDIFRKTETQRKRD